MPRYRVIVTRDTSESVVVTLEAVTADEANDKAIEYVYSAAAEQLDWQQDDYAGKPYVGDPDGAEELDDDETEAIGAPVARQCSVCFGWDGEHDWEVHTAEMRAQS